MENYTNLLKNFFGTNRECKRNMFKIMGTLYRAVTKGRITWEQGLEKVNSLGGIKEDSEKIIMEVNI